MLRPFLLVGVGGSGGKTLRVIREELLRRLQQAGWKDDLPKAWQFVYIDVPTTPDGNEPDLPSQLPGRDYTGMVAPGLTYRTLDANLVNKADVEVKDALGAWRPDPNKVNIPVSKGAGQFRAIGRMVTLTGLDRVYTALESARRALTGAEVTGELQRLTTLLGGEPSPQMADPTVIVISSIAGGSGGGAVIDVCDALRALGDTWASESLGLLYAPDVFDYLPEEHRKGVRPNSLAALSEILAGYWNSEGPSEEAVDLLALKGVQLGAANRLGPRYPFLVGNRNEWVSYSTQNDIYRAMGRSISAWVTSPQLQDRITAYLQGNWSQAASSLVDNLPLHLQGTETPFSALGSARVGLGRDRFRRYAGERLAKAATERLLRAHLRHRAENDDRSDHAIAQDVASKAFPRFLAHSGLDERTEVHNEILDALRTHSAKDDTKAVESEIFGQVQKNMAPKGESRGEVSGRILRAQKDRSRKYLQKRTDSRVQKAQLWVEEIQGKIQAQVASHLASDGGPVTILLMQRLITEMEAVTDELRQEAQKYMRWAADVAQEVDKALDIQAERLLPENPAIRKGTRAAADSLHWQAEAELRELAVELVPDLIANVLRPMEQALKFAVGKLEQEERRPAPGEPAIADWPDADVVPARLAEAPNEFLLESTSTYPEILRGLLARTMQTQQHGSAFSQAIESLILGVHPESSDEQTLIARDANWVPRVHALSSATPSNASFSIGLSAKDLLAKADSWMTKPGTAISRYLEEDLAGYLSPEGVEPQVHAQRLERFEGQFIAALNASAPLVKVNSQVLVQVHDEAEARSTVSFSELPFADRTPAREKVRQVLQARGQWSAEIEKAFTDGSQAFIDMFATLNRPYEPVVFDSLMQPIAREWGKRSSNADLIQEFWRWRRARPLTETLPLSPAVRESMVRGWFTASQLKQLRLEEGRVSVFMPDGRGKGEWVDFPDPLLTGSLIAPQQYLPVALESILLAMVDVNTTASLKPMHPYRRLRDLGRSGSGSMEAYEDLNSELRAWILAGDQEGQGGWQGRRDEVVEHLTQRAETYQNYFTQIRPHADPLDVPSGYDLRRDIMNALRDLRKAALSMQASADVEAWN